ncbi:MAG TPA: LuxR family transcriptional regulator [Patescibacteria group bacterium]|nr:LuxR family transcriptional regulator [Patescibacteria group bacterium]
MIEAFIETSLEINDLDALIASFRAALARIGFDRVTFALLSVHKGLGNHLAYPQIVFSDLPQSFLKDYSQKKLYVIDPLRARVFISDRPFKWADVAARGLTKRQADFIAAIRDAGFYDGVSIPLRGPRGAVAVVGVASSEVRDAAPIVMTMASLLAHQFYSSYLTMNRNSEEDTPIRLSSREAEILQWCAVGKTRGEIAAILGISTHTVNIHAASALRKFGTNKITVAAVEALFRGLIQI